MLIEDETIYYSAIKWEMLVYNSKRWSHYIMVYPHLYNSLYLVDGVALFTKELCLLDKIQFLVNRHISF